MSSHTTKSQKAPIDIITYRYDGGLVYVPVATDYVQALSYARGAFPQLKKLHHASLSLSLTVPGHGQQSVGISALAWPKLILHMSRYQVIDVHITESHEDNDAIPIPHIDVTYADSDDAQSMVPTPPYCRSDVVDDEKASYLHPRPPSPSTLYPGIRHWLFQKLHVQ